MMLVKVSREPKKKVKVMVMLPVRNKNAKKFLLTLLKVTGKVQ
jgi:hypothetical protein